MDEINETLLQDETLVPYIHAMIAWSNDLSLEDVKERWPRWVKNAESRVHFGDCTKSPGRCSVCLVAEVLDDSAQLRGILEEAGL